MKTRILAVISLLAGLACGAAADQPSAGAMGGGIELGEQNGVTGAYWLAKSQDVEAGLGDSAGEFSFHAEYAWHAWDILPKPPQGAFSLYGSLGFRVRDNQFGLRPVGGVDYWVANHPIQFFVEAGPIFRLTPNTAVDGTGAVGVRFYFTPRG